MFSVPSTFPKNIKCECKSQKGTSLEINWIKLSAAEARGKLLYINVHYQNVDEFKPKESKSLIICLSYI